MSRELSLEPIMEYLTVAETARLLRVSPITVRRYIASGRLAADRVGRGIRIRREAIEEFVTPVEPEAPRSVSGPHDELPTIFESLRPIIGIGRSSRTSNIAKHNDENIPDSIETWRDTEDESELDKLPGKPTSVDDPHWGVIGIGRSKEGTDVARNKHKYLAEAVLSEDSEEDELEALLDRPFTMDDPLWTIFGTGASKDPTEVAENKHEYLAEAYLADKG